ncbi:PHP domain-containing protein [Hydrogenophaga palleronii]|uniref:PHP domain-containing protein n=1 Tax=Hydrogenophaga palleronii TaxID=65655 RepID=UPI000826E52D|nr:PHP domain-containing protein [Hydrogenophaga palleronii]
MKKIDLHIHTISTISDRAFKFSLDSFRRYVSEAKLDAVAVTNHDVFDAEQFRAIQQALEVVVFPGIEINVAKGHVLVIARPSEIDDFAAKADVISQRITKIGDCISVEELTKIFGDLKSYLVIPHYDKGPPITGEALEQLKPFVSAGEVDSAKKFVRAIKDPTKLTPVLFSDSRMMEGLASLPTRQTFVDCGVLTLEALKSCLLDKAKVALSERDGNKLWQVLDSGQMLSTGLNVLIGARSTGKTHTLDQISNAISGCKYIKQFSLVQQDEAVYEREFKHGIERRRSALVDQYLAGLKRVIDDVVKVDLDADDREVGAYLDSLLKSAAEADRRDAFSKAALFDEVEFPVGNATTLQSLIESVRQVIENLEYREIIEKHVDLATLKRLAVELIELLRGKMLDTEKRRVVNALVKEIKQGLKFRTAAVQVQDVDLYAVAMDKRRVMRFTEIVECLKKDAVILQDSLQGFRIEATKQAFAGAGEVRAASGAKIGFTDVFRKYENPYNYLRELARLEGLPSGDYYKLFAKISYRILNRDGHEVSGGERSEFRLLQEIADAQNHDLLLIDEPESSFDNLFLKSEVNQILKSLSETMPVVVVTHNNTVGASIDADYLLHTTKDVSSGKPVYRIFSGYPTDKSLTCVDGTSIESHATLMNSLEAGADTYEKRRQGYEAVKDQ